MKENYLLFIILFLMVLHGMFEQSDATTSSPQAKINHLNAPLAANHSGAARQQQRPNQPQLLASNIAVK